MTYRVRQIPINLNRDRLPNWLSETNEAFGQPEMINVHSLSSHLSPWDRPPKSTATITFKKTPSILESQKTELILSTTHQEDKPSIIIDSDFAGFTALNEPEPDKHMLE